MRTSGFSILSKVVILTIGTTIKPEKLTSSDTDLYRYPNYEIGQSQKLVSINPNRQQTGRCGRIANWGKLLLVEMRVAQCPDDGVMIED